MIVFPFGGDEKEIDLCAAGLGELNSPLLSAAMDPVGGDATAETEEVGVNKTAYSRVNSITIRKKDLAKLEAEQWLNDTLIDFWMEWYVTYYTQESSKDVHVSFVFFAVPHY